MKHYRSIKVADFETVEQPEEGKRQVISVAVSYNAGGMDYSDYKVRPRGYWLNIRKELVSQNMREFMMFSSGLRTFIEETKRFNAKRLEALAAGITETDKYKRLLEAVLAEQGVTLKEPVAA